MPDYDRTPRFDRYTVEQRYQRWTVYAWGTYPKGSVREGEPMKQYIDQYATREAALADYPQADDSHPLAEPAPSLDHLPEDDPPVGTPGHGPLFS